MKNYRGYIAPWIGLFFIALIALLIGVGVPGCATPQQNAQLRTLSQLGLAVAASQGVISTGDAIVIGDGIGTLTSGADKKTKLVHLASIGLQEAVRQDLLKQGDTVLIQSAVEALVIHPPVTIDDATLMLPADGAMVTTPPFTVEASAKKPLPTLPLSSGD